MSQAKWATAATTLALVAVLPATTQAEYVYPNETPATDGLLYEAVRKADEFWLDKTGRVAGDVRLCMLTEKGVAARAEQPGHKVWFERTFVAATRRMIASSDRGTRRLGYEQLFLVAAHERGHNLGFKHEDLGIMGKDPGTPGIGVDWAKERAR